MLVPIRHSGGALHVSSNITVMVLGNQGNQVRLGITAPNDVTIHRSRIYRQIGNVRPMPPTELVEAWNRKCPVPALIEYWPYQGAEPRCTRTVNWAGVPLDEAAVIWTKGQSAPVTLRTCTTIS